MICRDFATLFIGEDATETQVISLLGEPQRDVGSGVTVYEWDMPFGSHYRISCREGHIYNRQYTANGIYIQAAAFSVVVVMAVVSVAALIFCLKKRKTV